MSRRRFRPQPVTRISRVFSDSADSHADDLFTAGATFPSLPSSVPRGGVRRLLDLDSTEDKFLPSWGKGATSPFASPQSVRRRSPVVRVVAGVPRGRSPITPLQAKRRHALSMLSFQRLQANPRERLCVRRLQRKQVLFAKRVAGRRGGSPGPYRRNYLSSWSC